MAYKAMNIPKAQDPPTREFRLEKIDGGLCLEDLEMKLKDNQSPRMKNIWYSDRVLSKRYGQEYVYDTAVASVPVYQAYERKYKGYIIFHCGTKLWKLDTATGTTTEIFSGLTAQKGSFFKFNDILYYINGAEFIQWNGTAAAAVTPYIPTVVLNRTTTGGGSAFEDYNRLGAGFINGFVTDGTVTTFPLTLTNLDATAIVGSLDAGVTWDKVESTHFTVNRTTGIVTWLVAPTTGQNTMRMKAYKTDTTSVNSIKKCIYSVTYSGDNDTRVFLGGNGTNTFYWSGLQDPTYWPDQNYNIIGANDDNVTGFGKQYDILVVFKARETYSVQYKFDGTVGFDVKQISGTVGCDMPWTIQLINNNLAWCNTYAGVHIMLSTQIKDERDIQPISRNINGTIARPGLLSESNLTSATSLDYKGKYWLCVNDNVYLWDYNLTPYQYSGNIEEDAKRLSWFYFDNINANTWVIDGEDWYYGDRTTGKIIHFVNNFRDFGGAIEAYWRMALRDFGLSDMLKTVLEIWITSRTDTYSKINIKYITENGDVIDSQPITISSFSWASFAWDTFAWSVINYGKTFRRKPKLKKILYFAVELSNNDAGRDINILDLVIKYRQDRKVK